jgi:UDP-2,3-diacylglucosamine pyrophosphatase LpxH
MISLRFAPCNEFPSAPLEDENRQPNPRTGQGKIHTVLTVSSSRLRRKIDNAKTMKTLILSDLHLGSRHSNIALLNEVLDRESFDRLILNGDTIHHVNMRKMAMPHWQLLDRFREIGKSRELVLVRGNHDHGTDYLPGTPTDRLSTANVLPGLLGVPMREDYQLQVNGHRYLVMHGDRFDPTMSYPVVTEVAYFCYQFTTKINKKLAKWLKKKSKKWGGLLEIVRKNSIAHAQKGNIPGIITGHTHFAENLHEDEIHYVNSGSWTENLCSYLLADEHDITLHHLPD